MLEVIKVNALSDVKNKILHERAERARCGRSQEFIAMVNGFESAFFSYEDWSDRSVGFIYEIFVLPNCRWQGIGAALLSYSEALAIGFGYIILQLEANAFDRTVDPEWLVSWYKKKATPKKLMVRKRWRKLFPQSRSKQEKRK